MAAFLLRVLGPFSAVLVLGSVPFNYLVQIDVEDLGFRVVGLGKWASVSGRVDGSVQGRIEIFLRISMEAHKSSGNIAVLSEEIYMKGQSFLVFG